MYHMPFDEYTEGYQLITLIEKSKVSYGIKKFYYLYLYMIKEHIFGFLFTRKVKKAKNEQIISLYKKVFKELFYSVSALENMNIESIHESTFSYEIINGIIVSSIYYIFDTNNCIIEMEYSIDNDNCTVFFKTDKKSFNLSIKNLEVFENEDLVRHTLLLLYAEARMNILDIFIKL